MLVLLACFSLGAAFAVVVALGGPLSAPAEGFLSALHSTGSNAVHQLLDPTGVPDTLIQVTAAAAGAMLPGLVCLFLVEAALAGTTLRRSASLALLLGAGVSFMFLPATTALLLLLAAVATALLLWLTTGPLLMGPVAAATGFVAAVLTSSVLTGTNRHLSTQAAALETQLALGGGWPIALAALALLPVLACVVRLLRG